MGKIKEFLKNLFTIGNLLSGLVGLGIGMFLYVIGKIIGKSTFQDIAIFIGVGISFTLIILFLGFLLNKTLFKDDN